MMIRSSSILLCMLLLLSACSSGSGASRARPIQVTQSEPGAALTERALPGRLLYIRDKQLWLHQGTEARPVQIGGEGSIHDPAWSPDGRRIAFIQRQESFSDLYILDVQSGTSSQVTDNGRSGVERRTREYVHQIFWALEPTWSPDGDEIIFLSQEQTATGEGDQPPIYEFPLTLFRYDTNLIGTREPTNADVLRVKQQNSDIVGPAWSPDGRRLVYVEAPRGKEPRRVMLYDFETEQAAPYPGIPEGAYDPAWSPDGQRLAFAVSQAGATDIWVIGSPESSETAQRYTTLGRARAPAWAPDGSALAFLNVGENSTDLYLVDLAQQNSDAGPGEAVQITSNTNIDATAGLSWAE